jgi:hypothetical protein
MPNSAWPAFAASIVKIAIGFVAPPVLTEKPSLLPEGRVISSGSAEPARVMVDATMLLVDPPPPPDPAAAQYAVPTFTWDWEGSKLIILFTNTYFTALESPVQIV